MSAIASLTTGRAIEVPACYESYLRESINAALRIIARDIETPGIDLPAELLRFDWKQGSVLVLLLNQDEVPVVRAREPVTSLTPLSLSA